MWALLQTHYSKHHQAYVSKLNGEAASRARKLSVSAVYQTETVCSLVGMRAVSVESGDAASNCRGMQLQGHKLLCCSLLTGHTAACRPSSARPVQPAHQDA